MVDNSVDDQESDAAERLAKSCPQRRLRYIRNERHLTACENFNHCIDLADTDLVATVHGDDEVRPCYAGELTDLAARNPLAAVLFTAVTVIDDASRYKFSFVDWFKGFLTPRGTGDIVLSGEASLRSIARGDWLNGAAICYRKSRLGDLRWDSKFPMASDLELWSRVLVSGRTMAGTRRVAYAYRRHRQQTTVQLAANHARFLEESKVLDLIARRAEDVGWSRAARTARTKTILQLHVVYTMAGEIAKGSLRGALTAAKILRELRSSKGFDG